MELSKVDTRRFLFDPKRDQSFLGLKKHKEFQIELRNIPEHKIFPYIILMYDLNNDQIRNEFPFYPQRKVEVAKMVGLIPRGRSANRTIEDVLIGKNEDVNKMIIKYLTLFNNPDVLMLAAYYEIYVVLSKRSFSGQFKDKDIENIEKVNGKIHELTDNIFGGKDETELIAELYRTLEDQKLGIQPEEIAEKLQKGEDPLDGFNPYNSEYIPDLPKFLGSR